MKEQKNNPADNLYLLSFIDVIDRLDILMLEIRHLQQTIIHALKAPTLYLPLRFEEAHLFGNDWHKQLFHRGNGNNDFRLAKKWLIRYPTPEKAVNYYYINPKGITPEGRTYKQIEMTLKYRIGKIWMGDNWVRDQRRQYHALSALQVLKQRVLHDKIVLSQAALQADLLSDGKNTRQQILQKPAFLILREGILRQIDVYVSILRNHKHQIGQSLDFSMPSDPHPSIERRREMGIFMDFIFNRTLDIQRDILHLCSRFKHHEDDDEPSNGLWMFHGWSQNTNVSSVQLYDKINAAYNRFGIYEEEQQEQHIAYVNTSFWTPDRPDLHPMVAYPVAQSVVRNHLGGLSEVSLSNNEDIFTALIIRLKTVFIEAIKTVPLMASLESQLEDILKTTAADLLAASVKGVAYLYPLFITTVGEGLASQLYIGKEIKLDMVYSLERGTACYDDAILWYLRLQLTAFWVKNVAHEPSPLDKQIIAAVTKVCEELLDFLNRNTPASRQRAAPYWETLLATLINEINKSPTLRITKQWCTDRANDGKYEANDNSDELERSSKRRFPRSTRSLDIRLQNYLFRQAVRLKTSSNKALTHSKDLAKDFKKQYGLTIETITLNGENNRHLSHPPSLFSHIYSIPYQAAFIRSIDMLHKDLTDEDFFHQLHWDMELGRSLFGFALEFHARETESPEQRLSLCVNQVAYAYHKIKKVTKLWQALEQWLSANQDKKQQKKYDLEKMDDIATLRNICNNLKNIGAIHLIAAFERTPSINTKKTRYLEIIAGHKLRDLLEILQKKEIQGADKEMPELFSTLVQFLSIRRLHSEVKKEHPKKRFFYNKMLAALGDIKEPKKNNYEQLTSVKEQVDARYLPDPITSMLIKRISITNYYPISDPRRFFSFKNKNGMNLAKVLKYKQWQTEFNFNTKSIKQKKADDTWVILGRFDALSMIKVRLPCKCYIQGFGEKNKLPYLINDTNKQLNETFPPHFSRREIARPVALLPVPKSESGTEEPCEMFTILNVTLQRRSMRLDFLYRLVQALEDRNPSSKSMSNMEEEIKNLKENAIFVTGFLTDGWGDILFKFSKVMKKEGENYESQLKESDIAHIFSFQKTVYEDFMVDRTEITFAPQCIDHTLGLSEAYKVTLETRMMEDRWLEKGIDNYIKTIKKLQTSLPPFLQKVDMTMLSGRNDFKFTFTIKENYFDPNNQARIIPDAFIALIEWLEGKLLEETTTLSIANQENQKYNAMRMLSHVETYIEKQVIL